jgi:tRNA(adenine34) deaminase
MKKSGSGTSSDQNTAQNDLKWMRLALKAARRAGLRGEVPIGAVLVGPNGLVTSAGNRKELLKTSLGHAELICIHKGSKILDRWRLTDCTLYVTLEPCIMCAGALWQSRIGRLVFAASDPKGGAIGSLMNVAEDKRLNHQFEYTSGLLKEESEKLIQDFFKERRKQNRANK